MNRYSVNFEDRSIEPEPEGRWVKYSDYEQMEALIEKRAEEIVQSVHQKEKEEIQRKGQTIHTLSAQIAELTSSLEDIRQSSSAYYARQSQIVKEARDRLKLHGHSPNCDSRYSATSQEGSETIRPCNCGLDQWMKDSGVAHG